MRGINGEAVLGLAALVAILSGQLFMCIILLSMAFVWEDSKWTAFDADDYDKKIMNGPLKPWSKGN